MGKRQPSKPDKPKGKPGPKRKLSEGPFAKELRETIVRTLQVGGSRADAASAAGIDRTTLTDAVRIDREFAKRLERAELSGKILALNTVQGAINSKDERVAFKAAQWFLQVKHWRDWAKRSPDAIKPDDVVSFVRQLMEGLLSDVPPRFHAKIQLRLENGLDALRKRR